MKDSYRIIFRLVFIMYLSYLAYLVFFSQNFGRGFFHRNISIIPFSTIINYVFIRDSFKLFMINIIGNIVAFVPMGFLLPGISQKFFKFKNLILAVFFATMTVEVVQYIAGVGTSDIDDVILNLLGGIIGYFLFRVPVEIKRFYAKKL